MQDAPVSHQKKKSGLKIEFCIVQMDAFNPAFTYNMYV